MRPDLLALLSGLALALGVAVLLQQFAVWPLTAVTGLLLPVLVAVAAALLVRWRGSRMEDDQ